MKASPMETSHEVMTCPACSCTIRAKVTIEPNLGPATLAEDGAAVVPISPTIERFVINHHCSGRTTTTATKEPADIDGQISTWDGKSVTVNIGNPTTPDTNRKAQP